MKMRADGDSSALFARSCLTYQVSDKSLLRQGDAAKIILTPFNSPLKKFLQVMSSRVQHSIIHFQAGMPCLKLSDRVSLPYQFCQEDSISWL